MQGSAVKHKSPSLLKQCFFALAVCLATYKLIGYLYFLALSTHYSTYIPTSFDVEKTIFVGEKIGGFIEGCGVAIFSLSKKSSANIIGGGIAFLNQNSTISDEKHEKYNNWKETIFLSATKTLCLVI